MAKTKKKRMTQSDLRDRAWNLVSEIDYLLTSQEFQVENFRDIQWNEDSTVRGDVADYLDMNEEFFSHLQKIVETVKQLKAVKAKLRS